MSYLGELSSYGTLELTVSSPPQRFREPLEVLEVATYLNLPPSTFTDLEKNAELRAMIIAAREQAEILQGRDLVPKQWDLALDYFPTCVELRTPLLSVDLVSYRNSDGSLVTLAESTDYMFDTSKGLLQPAYGKTWPSFTAWPSSAVLVRFTSGYALDSPFWLDAGERIKVGMRMLVSAWFTNKMPFAIGMGLAHEMPFAVTHLLSSGAVPRVR